MANEVPSTLGGVAALKAKKKKKPTVTQAPEPAAQGSQMSDYARVIAAGGA